MGDHRREKYKLTKESILQLINETEDDFTTYGASIRDMIPVFEKFKIQVRIINEFDRPIFIYDPPKRDHHIPALYALVKNNHIYTINDNLQALKKILPTTHKERNITVRASPDCRINEKDEPIECKMIQSLDDIKCYAEHDGYTLIYDGNDLSELFYLSKEGGYTPQVKFSAGIVSELFFRFKINKKIIRCKVKTQNLVNSSVDGTISVRTEQIYNNMSKAMFKFNKSLFNPLHKSYYNEIDVDLFKECRTINPVGQINKHYYFLTQRLIRMTSIFIYQRVVCR